MKRKNTHRLKVVRTGEEHEVFSLDALMESCRKYAIRTRRLKNS